MRQTLRPRPHALSTYIVKLISKNQRAPTRKRLEHVRALKIKPAVDLGLPSPRKGSVYLRNATTSQLHTNLIIACG